MTNTNYLMATLAGGCFWCSQAIFKRLKGILSVTSGYAGGKMNNPAYDIVSSGETGHAEAIQISFDPKAISYQKILEVFFATHDPTTKNQQGTDIGSQYRSVIFYHNSQQKKTAEEMIAKLDRSGKYLNKIVTEIVPFKKFYKAEDYHQDFYEKNKSYPYCQIVIDPKIQKLYKEFRKDLKS